MRGKVIEVRKKDYKTKDGRTFTKIIIGCNVKINDKGTIKTLKASFSEQFAHDYFTYCNVKNNQELIGREVECTLEKKCWLNDDGVEKTGTYIKFLNLLDDKGNIIIMPKENSSFDF